MKRLMNILCGAVAGVLCAAYSASAAKATDFTVTDTRGTVHHLQSYLDAGKYVLIEFGYLG